MKDFPEPESLSDGGNDKGNAQIIWKCQAQWCSGEYFHFFNFVNCSFESALHWENNGSISADCNNCGSWGLFWLWAEGLQSQWKFIKCFDSC